MNVMKSAFLGRRPLPFGMEVRYERSFLLDLKQLDSASFRDINRFVFEEFPKISNLQELPAFRQIGASGIFYRFTLDRYFVSLEVTGQIVKFLRVMPIPNP